MIQGAVFWWGCFSARQGGYAFMTSIRETALLARNGLFPFQGIRCHSYRLILSHALCIWFTNTDHNHLLMREPMKYSWNASGWKMITEVLGKAPSWRSAVFFTACNTGKRRYCLYFLNSGKVPSKATFSGLSSVHCTPGLDVSIHNAVP